MAAISKKGYEAMRETVPMIGYTTLKQETKDIYVEEGVIEAVEEYLIHLKNQPGWTQSDFLCTIDYDEIHLKNVAQLCTKTGRVVGPYSEGFLLTVRGITKKWSFPYYTNFNFPPTKDFILYIVKRLYEIGLIVLMVVSDQGPKNVKLFNEAQCLKISQKSHFTILVN